MGAIPHERGATLVVATDNDKAGDDYANLIKSMSPEELEILRHTPDSKDWNDDLKNIENYREDENKNQGMYMR